MKNELKTVEELKLINGSEYKVNLNRLSSFEEYARDNILKYATEIERLKFELAKALEDGKMLDWLEKTESAIGRPCLDNNNFYIFTNELEDVKGVTLRSAIDAAIKQDQKK